MHARFALLPIALCAASLVASCDDAPATKDHDRVAAGQSIYQSMCKGCHGGQGEGGSGPSLRDWGKGHDALVSIIDETMPLGNADACTGDCALDVAEYILATFHGPLDCATPAPTPRALRLLTTREYRATISDLTGVGAGAAMPTCGLHTFSYAPTGTPPAKVTVSGSFNGWPGSVAQGAWPMALSGGAWSLTKQLAPGTYQYKFVLDDSKWIADPSDPVTSPDGFGGTNSVLTIACAPMTPTVDVGANLPPDTRPLGFLFDDDAPGRVVTSIHSDEYLRTALAVSAAMNVGPIVTCDPKADTPGCAHAVVASFGQRALRRPLTAHESTRFESLVTSAPAFEKGVRTAVAAMLVSPGFLYRSELGDKRPDGTFALTPWEIASLLSYTLWGTMPDEALFASASTGELATPAGLEKQARRLLASPRAREQISTFAEQWLGSETISTVDKNATLYPDFDASIRSAMREETKEVVAEVFMGTRHFDDLFTADWTMANDRLAAQYGIAGVTGSDMRKVTYSGGARAGVLGHGSILGATGLSDQTSPIRRGLFVRRRLLCQEFGTPPANAGGLPKVDPNATTRERFAQHTADPACKSCHQYIDDTGFGFERFDTVGRQRDTENGKPIDAAGDMNDVEGMGTGTHAPFSSLPELGQILASSHAAKACVVKQYWRFARGTVEPDACSLSSAQARFLGSGGDPQELMLGVILSPDFLVRR